MGQPSPQRGAERAMETRISCPSVLLGGGVTVGKILRTTITRTVVGDEPMVQLDSAAITERIGSITHSPKPAEPIYVPVTARPVAAEPRWRTYLRPRTAA